MAFRTRLGFHSVAAVHGGSHNHPLMYYAIVESLTNISQTKDAATTRPVLVTRPVTFHSAMIHFMRGAGVEVKKPNLENFVWIRRQVSKSH